MSLINYIVFGLSACACAYAVKTYKALERRVYRDIKAENSIARRVAETLYVCSPDKNNGCDKTNCFINGGTCFMTSEKKYAKD